MTKKMMMKKAHRIAKELEGDYRARLSYALKQVWGEVKEKQSRMIRVEMPNWLARKNRIGSGICKGNGIIATFEKVRETENAILVIDDFTGQIWLPKSQIKVS